MFPKIVRLRARIEARNIASGPMRVRAAILASAVTAALSSAGAHSAETADIGDLSIEQLMELNIASVFGASRYEQRVTEAPASISIVTADDIRRFGYTNFPDVLRSVRGLYVTDDRNYTYLGVRGFQRPGDFNTRVLVLIDGHRMNENVYDSGAIARDAMLEVELIDRIEIVRGPSSSVYGSSAFLAVINVITKQGRQVDGAELTQEAGSFDTYKTSATYGTTFANGVDWLASASHYSSSGADRLYYPEYDQRISDAPRARANGLAIGLDDEEAAKLFTSVRVGNVTASAYVSDRTKTVPTASYDTMFGDPNNQTNDQRGYVDLASKGELGGSGLHYRARAFYDYFKYQASLPYDWALPGDPPEVVLMRDSGVGEWLGGELQLQGSLFSDYTFVVGTEYRANVREDQTTYDDIQPREYYLKERRSSDVLGAFVQAEAKVLDDFSLTGGLRYDRYSNGLGDTLNPRFAAIYHPTPSSAVKLLYGEAFRAPNPYERYYYYEEQQQRPALRPETIRTYEAVYEHYFAEHYRFNVSAYHYDIDGLITQTASDTQGATSGLSYYYANVDAVAARGLELELEAKFPSGLLARASYVLQRAKDNTTDLELSSSPHQIAKLNVSVPIPHTKLLSNLELQYQSNSITLAGAHSPDFMLTNLSLTTATLWPNVELTAAVYNALDAKHVYPGAEEHLQDIMQLNGRTFQGKLVVRF